MAHLQKDNICPICGRELGDILVEEHHLIPRTFKGQEVIKLHKICHRKIHSLFSERQMLKYYHTIERLLLDKHLQLFIEWIKNKPLDYYSFSEDSYSRKSKRPKKH
jgi:hypothetical protein